MSVIPIELNQRPWKWPCYDIAKHTALWSESKDWLLQNQDNVSECVTCVHTDCFFSELAQ